MITWSFRMMHFIYLISLELCWLRFSVLETLQPTTFLAKVAPRKSSLILMWDSMHSEAGLYHLSGVQMRYNWIFIHMKLLVLVSVLKQGCLTGGLQATCDLWRVKLWPLGCWTAAAPHVALAATATGGSGIPFCPPAFNTCLCFRRWGSRALAQIGEQSVRLGPREYTVQQWEDMQYSGGGGQGRKVQQCQKPLSSNCPGGAQRQAPW